MIRALLGTLRSVTLVTLLAVGLPISQAYSEDDASYVKLPLTEYSRIIELGQNPKHLPRAVPGTYALGTAAASITVPNSTGKQNALVAEVRVDLTAKVLENEWTVVPILPAGTSVGVVLVNGQTAELMATPSGLAWATDKAGSYAVHVEYKVDVVRGSGGSALPVPLPQATSTSVTMELPSNSKNISIIPAAGIESGPNGSSMLVRATVPSGAGMQITWNDAAEGGFAISRASYSGIASEHSVAWTADIAVEIFSDAAVTVPLLPASVTLRDIRIDQKPASILMFDTPEGPKFATRMQGRGVHSIAFEIESAIDKDQGPSRTVLRMPAIPVSKVALKLDGKKELTTDPQSAVTRKDEANATIATVYVPLSEEVTLTWTEAVPEEVKAEARTNATLYHVAFAEENVLTAKARVEIEVTRGETNLLQFDIPKGVQVNQVSSADGGVADWRVEANAQAADQLSVYLDRQLQGSFTLEIAYDTSIVGKSHDDSFAIPLLRMRNVHRQRGMVALLASKELTFRAVDEKELSRVGENQLPPVIRQAIDKTVALSYKYAEAEPTLMVQLAKPEKLDGKFDADVNTLVSLSDVTLKGSASVDIHVKSGTISELLLEVPQQVNVLTLSAPSLRIHRVAPDGNAQLVTVEFTQDMEGDFRVELAYERILGDGEQGAAVPTIRVRNAEVEQGRIAVEALSAVEVLPEAAEQLSAVEPSELPQQLVLKTTNPILLAYKYAHVTPPYKLALKIRRHKQIDVQSAAIDEATYRTLYTQDGLAVTNARFTVRNSREQFLRVRLPAGVTIWYAAVDGKPEKPALAEDGSVAAGEQNVLVKIINSAQPFTVDLVYQSPVDVLGRLGVVRGTLPKPELIVTRTNWEVYLPNELRYGRVRTNMSALAQGVPLAGQAMSERLADFAGSADRAMVQLPQANVPLEGVLFSFTKLYANRGVEDAYFAVPYASQAGAYAGQVLAMLGILLLAGALLSWQAAAARSFGRQIVMGAAGIALSGVLLGYYGIDHRPSLVLAGLLAFAFAARKVNTRLKEPSERLGPVSADLEPQQ